MGVIAVSLMAAFVLCSGVVHAKSSQEYRQDADRYYLEQNFKRAYRIYFKLAKTGDHHSQVRLADMYANGEGKKVDLEEAYAWAALAAESGESELLRNSEALLQQIEDRQSAQQKAARLIEKYGKEALGKKAGRQDLKNFGRCTGSRINCS